MFDWATGTTLAAAIAAALTARSTTWAEYFSAPNQALSSPWLRMPLIRIYTTAANGTLGDGTATVPLPQSVWFGPLTIEKTDTITYTGAASANVLIEC